MTKKEKINYNFLEPYAKESLEDYIIRCKTHLINFPYLIIPLKNYFQYYPITWDEEAEDFEYYLTERWKRCNTSYREAYLKSIRTSISNLRPQELDELKKFINNFKPQVTKISEK